MIHVVGKDIAKFHCVIWEGFLKAADLPMPKMVINHGHWLKNKVRLQLAYLLL
jgi:methionyl-tRNA synthetase